MCYDCDRRNTNLNRGFQPHVPQPCDDVFAEGAMEEYWAHLLEDEARRAFVDEVRHAEEDHDPNVTRVIIAPTVRFAELYARDRGWSVARDRLVLLAPGSWARAGNALRGLRKPLVYRLDHASLDNEAEALLARLEPREMPVGERWDPNYTGHLDPNHPARVARDPSRDIAARERARREEADQRRAQREMLESPEGSMVFFQTAQRLLRDQGYSGVVSPEGWTVVRDEAWDNAVSDQVVQNLQGIEPTLEIVDETHHMTLAELEAATRRIMSAGREHGRAGMTWLPAVQNSTAPTAEELAMGRSLTGFQTVAEVQELLRPPAQPASIDWDADDAPGSNWREALNDLEDDGPGDSSGMPFMWASTLARHPGWDAKRGILRVYRSPYEREALEYRLDELEEDVRWF